MREQLRKNLQDNSRSNLSGPSAKHLFYKGDTAALSAWEACTGYDKEQKQHGLPPEFLGTLLVAAGNRMGGERFDTTHFTTTYSNDVSGSFGRNLIAHRTMLNQLGHEAYVERYAASRFRKEDGSLTATGQALMDNAINIAGRVHVFIDSVVGAAA